MQCTNFGDSWLPSFGPGLSSTSPERISRKNITAAEVSMTCGEGIDKGTEAAQTLVEYNYDIKLSN